MWSPGQGFHLLGSKAGNENFSDHLGTCDLTQPMRVIPWLLLEILEKRFSSQ